MSDWLVFKQSLCEKCPNTFFLSFFWSVFSRIRTECGEILSVFSWNARKYGQKKLRIYAIFMQWISKLFVQLWVGTEGRFLTLFWLIMGWLSFYRKWRLSIDKKTWHAYDAWCLYPSAMQYLEHLVVAQAKTIW